MYLIYHIKEKKREENRQREHISKKISCKKMGGGRENKFMMA
ncbi:MAG: hypothetical protein ABJB76_05300 [Candidatus Nitrosocosmicus sp.]